MACNNGLIVKVKQGEELNLAFTIKQGGLALDLTGYNISFKVKKSPTDKSIPIIDKLISNDSDINTIGQINFPNQGQFTIHLTKEDTSYPISEYYLVISIIGNNLDNIISSEANSTAKFYICEQ